ncbi:hypothetical protein HPG69_006387 [Diceros bicornis minor]|uniref:MHC class I-like antigen recognition-like domain-containing protein n=1 Tax=Diceros bicornis minor TaxID=77932 RepID=A0A7J7EWQ7_DICBM|nr:hypothetical protein HPG69_006387 [Diceros bicornis minor]
MDGKIWEPIETSRIQSPSKSSRSHPFTTIPGYKIWVQVGWNEEWMELEKLFRVTSIAYLQAAHNFANQWKLEYPFELQTAAGCELHFGEGSVGFMCIAYQGSDYLSFQNNSFLPSPKGGSKAQHVCRLLNEDKSPHLNTFPVLCSKARGLAVHWPQSWPWPSDAGLSRLWLPPKAYLGDVDEGTYSSEEQLLKCRGRLIEVDNYEENQIHY